MFVVFKFIFNIEMACFVSVNLLIETFHLSSKSVFVTKFASFNLPAKVSSVSSLNSGVVWLWSLSLFSISVIFML